MSREKFNTEQLIRTIKFLGSSFYSSDTIHTYKQSPIHILVYEEILKWTKEEIDYSIANEKSKEGYTLWGITFNIKNPYIFSAFLKKGAFQDKLHPDIKWLLAQSKNPSDDLYALAFDIQHANNIKNQYISISHDEPYSQNFLFKSIFDSSYNNFNKLDTPEKIQIANNYVRDFGVERENELLYFLYKNYDEQSKKIEICHHLVSQMKKIGIDFSNNDLLNNFLPKETYLNEDSKTFFISSSDRLKIKNLLKCGFQFNEKAYSFYGNNLFKGVLLANTVEVIETILPNLKDITPKSGTLEEQHQFVKELLTKVRSQELAQLIQRTYDRLTLNYELSNDRTEKKKLKI